MILECNESDTDTSGNSSASEYTEDSDSDSSCHGESPQVNKHPRHHLDRDQQRAEPSNVTTNASG